MLEKAVFLRVGTLGGQKPRRCLQPAFTYQGVDLACEGGDILDRDDPFVGVPLRSLPGEPQLQ